MCADAFQAYRGLDIGTAKPSKEDLQRNPYHLIDIFDPHEQYSAGRFFTMAETACREIADRGNIPVLEGGSVFYLYTFLTGMPESPPASADIRKQVRQEAAEKGNAWLFRELQRLDPVSAARIPEGDTYRLKRALEVCRQSGRPASSFSAPAEIRETLQPLVLGLMRERSALYERIDVRVQKMFDAGLPDEVDYLRRSGYSPSDPGLRAIGYREFWDENGIFLKNPAETMRLIQRNTRRLAKRQITFLQRIPQITLIAGDDTRTIAARTAEFCQGLDVSRRR